MTRARLAALTRAAALAALGTLAAPAWAASAWAASTWPASTRAASPRSQEDGPGPRFDPRQLPRAEAGAWAGLLEPSEDTPPPELDPAAGQLMMLAEERYRHGDYPGAIDALRRCLTRAPDFPPASQLLGTTLFRLQRYGDAAECLERFLTHAPSEVWRTQVLGHCYYSLGDYERALQHYARVLGAVPEGLDPAALAEARRGVALSHMRLGETERALAELRAVVELRPDHADAWSWIGQIEYEEGRWEAAAEALERARDLDEFDPRPWFLLAKVYAGLEREDDAGRALERWRDLDRLTQEVRSVEAKLRLQPRDYELALQLVELQAALGNTAGVREALRGLLLARPESMRELDVRIFVLKTLQRLSDREGALEAARALERAFPDEPETWKELEVFYAWTGDSMKQIEAGERYLRLRSH